MRLPLFKKIPYPSATQILLLKKHPHLKTGKFCLSQRQTVSQVGNHPLAAMPSGGLAHSLSREADPE